MFSFIDETRPDERERSWGWEKISTIGTNFIGRRATMNILFISSWIVSIFVVQLGKICWGFLLPFETCLTKDKERYLILESVFDQQKKWSSVLMINCLFISVSHCQVVYVDWNMRKCNFSHLFSSPNACRDTWMNGKSSSSFFDY